MPDERCRIGGRRRCARKLVRQIKGECASAARRAPELNLAAQESGKLTADRQSKACAAIFSARACIGLLESLEDDLLLLQRNANSSVGDLEGDDTGCVRERDVVPVRAAQCRPNSQTDAAFLREFEGIGQQVFENLLKPLRIGENTAAKIRVELDLEGQLPRFCLVVEGAPDALSEIGEVDLFHVEKDCSRLDLGKVEDIADKVEKIGACAVDGLCKLGLPRGQIAIRVLGELLTE